MKDVLTKEIRGRRLREIQKYQLDIQAKLRSEMEGKVFRVLVEKKGQMKGVTKWMGRTSCFRIVHFEPESLDQSYQWHWVDVRITQATALSCQGEVVFDYGRKPGLIQ